MYESPFDMVMTPLSIAVEEVRDSISGQIIESVLKATRSVNVTVDKEELLRALHYDRGQYDKGYADAKAEIVHCEDCVYRMKHNDDYMCGINVLAYIRATDFCSFGERETDG